ncbi:MAG: hypothetical protein Q9168_001851 [Polycauliona sp. 1 TL-2023]
MPFMIPTPVVTGPGNTASILESHQLDILLTTLPTPNRTAADRTLFTMKNALCCLRHKYPSIFNKLRRGDLQDELDGLQEHNADYVNNWNAQGPDSLDHKNADKLFRDEYAALQGEWANMLQHLEVVRTDEELIDHMGFPDTSLDEICTGVKMGMSKVRLAKALEKLYPTGTVAFPNKLAPFTADNVERIFEYLCSAGWTLYDHYFLADAEDDIYKKEREQMFAKLEKAADEEED